MLFDSILLFSAVFLKKKKIVHLSVALFEKVAEARIQALWAEVLNRSDSQKCSLKVVHIFLQFYNFNGKFSWRSCWKSRLIIREHNLPIFHLFPYIKPKSWYFQSSKCLLNIIFSFS